MAQGHRYHLVEQLQRWVHGEVLVPDDMDADQGERRNDPQPIDGSVLLTRVNRLPDPLPVGGQVEAGQGPGVLVQATGGQDSQEQGYAHHRCK